MLIKPDQTPSSSSTATAAQTTCGNCGLEELRLLHHVRHRVTFRRLCTTCVLRLHPQSFCPTCFTVYNSPSPNDAVTCFKCYSSSHAECVGPNYANPYICPLCVNPNVPIFAPKKVKDLGDDNGGKDAANGEYRVIDKKSAKILLAAAKISAVSMSKAAVAARVEAERRAKDAALTRKRAREALEHVAYLVAKEKLKKKEAAVSHEILGSASSGIMVNSSNKGSNIVGSANAAMMRVGIVKEERRVGNVARGDGSSDVLAALNAVELREGEKVGNVELGQRLNDVVPMDVEENGRVETNAGLNYHGGAGEDIDQIVNHGGVGENVSNGDSLVLPRKNNQPVEQNDNVSGH